PFRFVDHTHADAVVTITNTPGGRKRIEEIYGNTVLIVPYLMPGFILSKEIYKLTQGLDWKKIKGIILLNHGIFTFHDEAKESYDQMIALVSKAEEYLQNKKATVVVDEKKQKPDLIKLARLRKAVSSAMGNACVAILEDTPEAVGFSNLETVSSITARGPIT